VLRCTNLTIRHHLVSRLKFCGVVSSPVTLSFVLYGCKTLYLILEEECRLRVFEIRVLKKEYGSMKDDVLGDWTGASHYSGNQIK